MEEIIMPRKTIAINPTDTRLIKTITGLEKRIGDLEKARQPQLIDWYEFNVALFSYQSNNVINVDSSILNASNFQIGDKVRIYQGGYKYFYVIKIDTTNNRVTLDAGDDYTFTNSSFTSVAVSRLNNPSGHPLIFDYSSSVLIYDGSGTDRTSLFTTTDAKYSMNGVIVQLWLELSTISLPAGIGSINVSTPFLHRDEMAQLVYDTSILLAGSYGTGLDNHLVYDWRDWVGTGVPGTYPSDAGLEIQALILGGTYDAGSWWFTTNISVNV